MKSQLLLLFVLFSFCFPARAENQIRERVYVHTDKDCYVAGETVWLKFYVITGDFRPSSLSKVGYIEICDTEKPQMQVKIALEKGSGAGKIKIPAEIPTGIYRLSGYTRYMRNEGEKVFFEKSIAIVNVGQQTSDPKRFEPVERYENLPAAANESNEPNNLTIKTDQNQYGNRKKVVLSIENIPDNTAELVVSVAGSDSIAMVPKVNEQEWLKQVKDTFRLSREWLPEYEGHIISGNLVPKPPKEEQQLVSTLAFAGKEIRYFNGQINSQTGTADFYTAGTFGKQQIVTSVISSTYDKVPYRLDLLSPFSESLPDHLPVLKIYPNEKQLKERYIGAQIQEKTDKASDNRPIQPANDSPFQPILSYDLDEYTRFGTIGETILEFISRVRVSKVGNSRKIRVFFEDEQRFNVGNTLVLLDGIPIYDHEDILAYNPMYIKKINVYDGRYFFGGENPECIVSFITRDGNLPFFQLTEGSQLFDYDCPQLPPAFEIPDYSNDEIRNSKKPDFRHTLYWNPLVELTKGRPIHLSFYTSDLCGEFKITVEGITADGKMIRGVSYFRVSE